MINDVIECIKSTLCNYNVNIYQIGSLAYGDYYENWSDLDFVVIAESYNSKLENTINKLILYLNEKNYGVLAGGGNSPVDINLLIKTQCEGVINSEYYFSKK